MKWGTSIKSKKKCLNYVFCICGKQIMCHHSIENLWFVASTQFHITHCCYMVELQMEIHLVECYKKILKIVVDSWFSDFSKHSDGTLKYDPKKGRLSHFHHSNSKWSCVMVKIWCDFLLEKIMNKYANHKLSYPCLFSVNCASNISHQLVIYYDVLRLMKIDLTCRSCPKG